MQALLVPMLNALVPDARCAARCSARTLRSGVTPIMSGQRVAASADLLEIFPTEQMSPVSVTELQLKAMQQGDGRLFWRFVSPEGKRATGTLRPSRRAYLVPPKYAELPLYAPLMYSRRCEVVGALSVDHDQYQCRCRVWPAMGERECAGEAMPAPPVEYIWRLTMQPLTRPTCYEDDPMQQGISTGPPFGGCWLVDEIQLDERFGGGGDADRRPAPRPTGGASKQLVLRVGRARSRQLAMASSDRPSLASLPAGLESVDGLTAEMLKGYGPADLQAAIEHLEVAIFDSPPFEKPNEVARRRSLALAYFLKGDVGYYPKLIPNAKEVLRQLKGDDAEMQYILGTAISATMEGEPSLALAKRALAKALELQPGYAEAASLLAQLEPPADDEAAAAAPPEEAASEVASEAASEEPDEVVASDSATPAPTVADAAPPAGFEWGLTL